ncbi:T9SS type A sorting domain-containing protein [Epilithonimonas vandammei]|jgi:hypothetical protein|uniref:T9SS C-terminal target domain-containing protein n=1 Tax=Epilithonimonas vandammei TaxID=2487072 RepID=A0A3G8Y2A5_9FLAO|nr:T9SS type A sorting domain-containing protein [Epilithonimonas vandammei]AZI39499.1 T9SS C-terminal target domain-containing protein [Epilithonimonas vandammei]
MKTKLFLFLLLVSTKFFSQQFDWENIQLTPPFDDLIWGTSFSQTVSGVTATATTSSGNIYADNSHGFGGASGKFVFTLEDNTSLTISFSSPVNITSIYIVNLQGNQLGTVTVTPTGGNNSIVTHVETNNGFNYTMNWEGITSFKVENSNGLSKEAIDTIQFTASSLGVNDNVKSVSKIYPNPTKDIINFSEESNAEVYDTSGKKLASFNNVKSADLSKYAKGVYIIIFTDKDGKEISRNKVIKN